MGAGAILTPDSWSVTSKIYKLISPIRNDQTDQHICGAMDYFLINFSLNGVSIL